MIDYLIEFMIATICFALLAWAVVWIVIGAI